jgi:cytochrome c5
MNSLPAALLVFSFSLISATAWADGQITYQQVCAVCHGQGVAGAPKAGDAKAWKKLIAEGQVPLTADGYMGVRAMPAKGGKADLSVADFAEAVVYMANQSGANWKAPDTEMLKKMEARIAQKSKAKAGNAKP